jgi:hypothetical protein
MSFRLTSRTCASGSDSPIQFTVASSSSPDLNSSRCHQRRGSGGSVEESVDACNQLRLSVSSFDSRRTRTCSRRGQLPGQHLCSGLPLIGPAQGTNLPSYAKVAEAGSSPVRPSAFGPRFP